MPLTNYLIWSPTKKKKKKPNSSYLQGRGKRSNEFTREFKALYNGVFIMDFKGLL